MVTEVVQTEVRDCLSSQAMTLVSGVCRIRAESTFVSKTIMTQTLPAQWRVRAIRAHRTSDRFPQINWRCRFRVRRWEYPPRSPHCAECLALLPPCCGRGVGRDAANASLPHSQCSGLPVAPWCASPVTATMISRYHIRLSGSKTPFQSIESDVLEGRQTPFSQNAQKRVGYPARWWTGSGT